MQNICYAGKHWGEAKDHPYKKGKPSRFKRGPSLWGAAHLFTYILILDHESWTVNDVCEGLAGNAGRVGGQ